MSSLSDRCIDVTIAEKEKGYVNDPDDRGGETKYGISKKAFPDLDIKNLTIEKAREIYNKKYWKPLNIDGINNELLCLNIYDMAVNGGGRTAVKLLQRALSLPEDGICGPKTTGAANADKDIIEKYISARCNYYRAIVNHDPSQGRFLKGWLNRAKSVHF